MIFAFFVSSLAALSEADATLALCHNVLFVQSHYVMLRDELFAYRRALWAHNGSTSNTLKSMGETKSGCNNHLYCN